MPIFTNNDIRKRRDLLKMTAATLGEAIGRDQYTIYNYENGKCDPDPDTIYQIAKALGDKSIWLDWMRTRYASFAEMVPEVPRFDLPGCIMALYSELEDVSGLRKDLMRDGADGKIDDPALLAKVTKEVPELVAVLRRFMYVAKGGK